MSWNPEDWGEEKKLLADRQCRGGGRRKGQWSREVWPEPGWNLHSPQFHAETWKTHKAEHTARTIQTDRQTLEDPSSGGHEKSKLNRGGRQGWWKCPSCSTAGGLMKSGVKWGLD